MTLHRIGFVYRSSTQIADQANQFDIKILRKHYDVSTIHVSPKNMIRTFFDFGTKAPKCDILYVWFAGFQAVLAAIFAKLFHKKMVLLVGGYDAAESRKIGYGAFLTWYRSAMAHFSYRNATLVLSVSMHTLRSVLRHDSPKKLMLLYNAVDVNQFIPLAPKERVAMTVAYIDKANIIRKGLHIFAQAASYFDDVQFVLVGKDKDGSANELRKESGNKLLITGYLSDRKLLEFFSKSSVYLQLSYEESFGIALAQAMSCECIPIVTELGALPEVVNDTGYYVPYGDVDATVKAVKKALEDPNRTDLGKKARERIVSKFSIIERERKLISMLNNL